MISDLAVLGFDDETKCMQVESLHPDVALQTVRDQTGFELLVRHPLETTPPPEREHLEILRNQVDLERYIIGRC